MEVEILGTRGNIEASAPDHKKHAGVLVDACLLFDLGETEYLQREPEHIFITHLHPDHAVFVSEDVELPDEVYAPEPAPGVKTIKRAIQRSGYKITPVQTLHSLKVASHGYVIDNGTKRLFYSGDIISVEKKYRYKLKDLDAVITDASFIREGGMIRRDDECGKIYGHAGMDRLIKLFSPYTDRIIFTHFGSWFVKNPGEGRRRFKQLADNYPSLQIELSYDGSIFNI